MGKHPTLYDWAGGRDSFDRMINAFYDRVEQDELLSPFFPGACTTSTVAMWPLGGARFSEDQRVHRAARRL